MAPPSHTDDPTLGFLRDLNDPAKYRVVENVPIFKPHKRKRKIVGPDGAEREETINVTDSDLSRVASVLNDRANGGVPVRITIGHISDGPETGQPPIVGWATNARVGRFGQQREPCVLGDMHIKVEEYDRASQYPFRSCEYYPKDGLITGLALLKRDPFLDLGIITYRREDPVTFVWRYDNMPQNPMIGDDPAGMGGTPPPEPIPGAVEPNPHTEPDQDDQPLTMRMLQSHPAWQFMCSQYQAAQQPPEPELEPNGQPGPEAPAAPPAGGMPMPEGEPTKLQRDADAVRYAKLEADVAALRAENERLNYERRLERANGDVRQLIYEGYVIPKPDAEAQRMAKLEDAAYRERLDEIRACYQRGTGPMIQVYSGPVERPAGPGMDELHAEKAMQYMRDHPGVSWADAKEKTKAVA